MQGNWQHLSVANNVITYRDHSRYQTLTIHSMGGDNPFSERLPVYIRDECGGESYSCIWLKNRGANVLEFQLGEFSSDTKSKVNPMIWNRLFGYSKWYDYLKISVPQRQGRVENRMSPRTDNRAEFHGTNNANDTDCYSLHGISFCCFNRKRVMSLDRPDMKWERSSIHVDQEELKANKDQRQSQDRQKSKRTGKLEDGYHDSMLKLQEEKDREEREQKKSELTHFICCGKVFDDQGKPSELKTKEYSCRFQLAWLLKCPLCDKRHGCNCRKLLPVMVPQPRRRIGSAMARSRRMSEGLEESNVLEIEDPCDKVYDKIVTETDNCVHAIDQISDLLNCLVRNSNLLKKRQLGWKEKYHLIRSKSDPSILCIRPPITPAYNKCDSETGTHDCIRINPNRHEVRIHGKLYKDVIINEPDFFNIVEELLASNGEHEKPKVPDGSSSNIEEITEDLNENNDGVHKEDSCACECCTW